jgi:hypothetical protein
VLLRREGWSVNLQMIVDEVIEAWRIESSLRAARGSDLETGRIGTSRKKQGHGLATVPRGPINQNRRMTTLCLAG